VVEPLDIQAVVFFHEFRELTLLKPQLEFYLQLSQVHGQINKNHYLYLLDVLDERLAWYDRPSFYLLLMRVRACVHLLIRSKQVACCDRRADRAPGGAGYAADN
jgi:hypothetical protein